LINDDVAVAVGDVAVGDVAVGDVAVGDVDGFTSTFPLESNAFIVIFLMNFRITLNMYCCNNNINGFILFMFFDKNINTLHGIICKERGGHCRIEQ
jgi:hypothetical protein